MRTSLLHLAQTNSAARELLVVLTQMGYMVHKAPSLGTSLVHRSNAPEVWDGFEQKGYKQSPDGIVYSLSAPRHEGQATALVIVFSTVAKNRFTQSLDRHFAPLFTSLETRVAGHTAILRIADMDGVVGGYYLPTVRDLESAQKIQKLISRVAAELGVPTSNVVTFGVSKGATGALYHGVDMDIKSVSVDPIISLSGRDTTSTDPYLSNSAIYPKPLDECFDTLLTSTQSCRQDPTQAQHILITSRASSEYRAIESLTDRHPTAGLHLVEVKDPHITGHAQVARNSLAISLAMLNMFAGGLPFTLPMRTSVE